ncbi:MAG TPA: hypothetical protein VKW04_05010 [Planctomycetota bacterium]|nr:hypothetical protein [Planctomycetota bacterium]
MAVPALQECAAFSPLEPADTALLLACREPHRADVDLDGRLHDLLAEVQKAAGITFRPESLLLPNGHAGVVLGLKKAGDLLASGKVRTCIVGGVDSYLNGPDVIRLRETWRLAGPEVPQGLFPGEAAAFLRVALRTPSSGPAPLGRITGLGVAEEPKDSTVLSDGHATGRGLVHAIEAAVRDAGLPEGRVGFRVSDLNGENYRGMETMLAGTRFYRTRREGFQIWHPADCVGDVGSAIGALLAIVALAGFAKGYAPERLAVGETSSEGGLRGAFLLAAEERTDP